MQISCIDHFVLTVQDIDVTCDFYSRACGMEVVTFAGGRKALSFGQHKINLHQAGSEFLPKAASPTRGSGDFCLISSIPLDEVIAHLETENIAIEDGPVARTGAMGPIRSIYFRDPDGNLVEISEYIDL
ncbi:VOC family protein [Brucella melitensis]|uniref:VOC family protein n=1 Tax=Brucella melitensis TaxID=29459 RepID=UPI001645B48A|nr:VOC family protein [Brucella melitensis]MBC3774114.1 VOC family protein [Brucella melitensis]